MNRKRLIQVTVIFALLTQISHASDVFYFLSDKTTLNYIMSWIFAIAVETSIYIFTMSGKRNTAIFFAFVSWSVNIIHYWFSFGFTKEFIGMNLVSAIIPLTIYFYSELINDKPKLGRPKLK
jgi:hypothetical protein